MAAGPFRQFGEVRDRDGTVLLAVVPCQVWRDASGTAIDTGESYDYACWMHADGSAALVEEDNRLLVVDGTEYRVVDALSFDVMPHLELALRRVL